VGRQPRATDVAGVRIAAKANASRDTYGEDDHGEETDPETARAMHGANLLHAPRAAFRPREIARLKATEADTIRRPNGTDRR
jgi:hypothetical protein